MSDGQEFDENGYPIQPDWTPEDEVKFAWKPKPDEPESSPQNQAPELTAPEPPEQEEVDIPDFDPRVRAKILASQRINSCGHCTYWVQTIPQERDKSEIFGECHKNPPVVLVTLYGGGESDSLETAWPATHATDFCAGACAIDWEGILRAEAMQAQQQEQNKAAMFRTGQGPKPPRRG